MVGALFQRDAAVDRRGLDHIVRRRLNKIDEVWLAEHHALGDIISGGRHEVGVGRGNRPSEFAGYRVSKVESRERFDEAVQIMVRAWTEERVSYDGRFFPVSYTHLRAHETPEHLVC